MTKLWTTQCYSINKLNGSLKIKSFPSAMIFQEMFLSFPSFPWLFKFPMLFQVFLECCESCVFRLIWLDYSVVRNTKLYFSFPKAQLLLHGYESVVRRNWNKFRVGLTEHLRRRTIWERLKEYEPQNSELVCSEITLSENGFK